jgi:hypothetical protein
MAVNQRGERREISSAPIFGTIKTFVSAGIFSPIDTLKPASIKNTRATANRSLTLAR